MLRKIQLRQRNLFIGRNNQMCVFFVRIRWSRGISYKHRESMKCQFQMFVNGPEMAFEKQRDIKKVWPQ